MKVFVDTAPIMEKPLAAAAGIGWQGKHTNLVSREHGSWLFLGAILTSAEIAPDAAEEDHCGSCRRCLDVCPTARVPGALLLDARRCLAYLSIEHKGHIPAEFRRPMGNRVFGCDDCLAVCPWNKFAEAAREARFAARDQRPTTRRLPSCSRSTTASFATRFAGTPIKRTGRDRFLRNVLIAAGNSGDEGLVPAIEALLRRCLPARARHGRLGHAPARRRDSVGERVRHSHLAREGDSARARGVARRLHELPVLLRARLQRAGARRGSSLRRAGASAERRARAIAPKALAAAGFEAVVFDGHAPSLRRERCPQARHARAPLHSAGRRRRPRASPSRARS